MSIGMGVTRVVESTNTALDSAADLLTVPFIKPGTVQRIGLVQDGGTDPGTDLVLAVDKRPTAGTDSDVNSRGAREELFTLSPTATIGQGNGVYKDADDRYDIQAGEELVLEVPSGSTGAAGSTAHVFVEYVELPFSGSKIGHMTEIT